MEQIRTFSDQRLDGHCIYCGGEPETREHVPSKVLLEKPYPDNLPIVSACERCNQGFSLDEEYFACLLECVLCGTTEPKQLKRSSIAKILKRKPNLKQHLEKAKQVIDGQTHFEIELDRINQIIKKLAQGHAKFENAETQFEEPISLWFRPINLLTDPEIEEFFRNDELPFIPEIGSRGFQRLHLNEQGNALANWKTVQEDTYSYSVANAPGVRVRMYIWNYIVAEAKWE